MVAEIVGTTFILNTSDVIDKADITLCYSPDWAILLVARKRGYAAH